MDPGGGAGDRGACGLRSGSNEGRGQEDWTPGAEQAIGVRVGQGARMGCKAGRLTEARAPMLHDMAHLQLHRVWRCYVQSSRLCSPARQVAIYLRDGCGHAQDSAM